MSHDQRLTDAEASIRDLHEIIRGLEADLRSERSLRLLHAETIREYENQLAEKNATLERLQRERAEFWSKLNDTADHAKDR